MARGTPQCSASAAESASARMMATMRWLMASLPPAAACTGYVRHVTHDEIADAIG